MKLRRAADPRPAASRLPSPGGRGRTRPSPSGEGGRVSGRMRVFGAIRSDIIALSSAPPAYVSAIDMPLRSIENIRPICRPCSRKMTPRALVSCAAERPPAIESPAPTAE